MKREFAVKLNITEIIHQAVQLQIDFQKHFNPNLH